MPTIDYGKQQTAAPLSYTSSFRTSNTTSQADITINPPDSRTGLIVTAIFTNIATTTTGTTLTLMFDGVTQFVWTSATTLALSLNGPALFATGANQTLVLRLNADAARTASNVHVTVATVRL